MPARLYTSGRSRTLASGYLTMPLLTEAREAQSHCTEEWGDWTARWERDLPTVLDAHDVLTLQVTADTIRLGRGTQDGWCPEFMDVELAALPDREEAIFSSSLSWYEKDQLVEAVAPEDEAAAQNWWEATNADLGLHSDNE